MSTGRSIKWAWSKFSPHTLHAVVSLYLSPPSLATPLNMSTRKQLGIMFKYISGHMIAKLVQHGIESFRCHQTLSLIEGEVWE